jgi:type IV pilus assembly protein PilQ
MKILILIAIAYSIQSQSLAKDSLLYTKIEKIEQQSNLAKLFEAISRNYQINVNVDPEVAGQTESFRFYNVQLKDILDYVTKRFRLELEFSGEIIRLKAIPPPKKEIVKEQELDIDYKNNLLSINIKNESLEKFAQTLGIKSGKSMLLDPYARSGKISGTIQNIPFDQGLKQILEMNGYRLKKDKNIYKIYHFYSNENKEKDKAGNLKPQKGIFVDYSDSLISVDIINGELSFVINDIVRKADIEAVFYGELKGIVNAKFSGGTIDNVFLRLFRNSNYTYKKQGNIYYFGEKTIKDLISQEVIKLKYLRAGEGQSSSYQNRTTLGSASNTFDSSNRSNIQSSTGTRQNTNGLDRSSADRSGNSRSVASSNKSSGAGFSADALFNELAKHNINAIPLLEQNAVLVSGTKQDIDDAKSIIRLIDKPIPQVLLETILIDINNRKGLDQEISAKRGAFKDSTRQGTSYLPFAMLFNSKDLSSITEKVGSFLGAKRFGILPDDFFAFISIQEQKSNIKIRGKYQLATLNGHEAYLSVGETRFFKINDGSIVSGNNNTTNNNVNFKERVESLEITNTIRIKPWVNQDGDVTVEIFPQLQTPRESGIDNTPPTISFRELESTVRLKNGETIILGGIIEEEHSDITRDYFPLLSWIPWIGDLFISRGKSESKKELLIYITPKVYMGDQSSDANIDPSDFK